MSCWSIFPSKVPTSTRWSSTDFSPLAFVAYLWTSDKGRLVSLIHVSAISIPRRSSEFWNHKILMGLTRFDTCFCHVNTSLEFGFLELQDFDGTNEGRLYEQGIVVVSWNVINHFRPIDIILGIQKLLSNVKRRMPKLVILVYRQLEILSNIQTGLVYLAMNTNLEKVIECWNVDLNILILAPFVWNMW